MDDEHNDNPSDNPVEQKSTAPATVLEIAIAQLRERSLAGRETGYREFWSRAREILEQFKTLKPLAPADRQRLWELYREVCDAVHSRQVEERHSLREESQTKRAVLETQIAEARGLLTTEAKFGAVTRARDLLTAAMQQMKSHTEAIPREGSTENQDGGHPVRLLKDDREAVWIQWQEVRGMLAEIQLKWQNQFQARASGLKESAENGEPAGILKKVRELQQEIFKVGLSREQREALRRTLNEAWKIAINRLQVIREERRARHAEWKSRMQENLRRWNEQVVRREKTLEHLRGQIEKLEGMLETARSDDHAERVRGWISETETKLRNTEETLVGLREKIASVHTKLKRG